jgi:hypothetical protein
MDTASGAQLDLDAPRPDDICVEDIADARSANRTTHG